MGVTRAESRTDRIVVCKYFVHAVSDAIAEIVADDANPIHPGEEGVPAVDGQGSRNGMACWSWVETRA